MSAIHDIKLHICVRRQAGRKLEIACCLQYCALKLFDWPNKNESILYSPNRKKPNPPVFNINIINLTRSPRAILHSSQPSETKPNPLSISTNNPFDLILFAFALNYTQLQPQPATLRRAVPLPIGCV